MAIEHHEEGAAPPYKDLDALLEEVPGTNGAACWAIYEDYQKLFETAPGSSHNHQTWPGGYADHVTDAMNIVSGLYDTLAATGRSLPFTKADALLVIFLHDLEKPFKFKIDEDGTLTDNPDIPDKQARAAKRLEVMAKYGIQLDEQQANAMKYVEGIRDDEYTPEARVMGELAALCHCADVLSARLWYNYPLPEGQDEWSSNGRTNSSAASFVLRSEIS
ncbi:MAG TPA: hypothetical protein VLE69_02765 [Candidatus Saccharimonadales bacterium]|nr:hypothetical protein [Candidatus Saccharimonadales bacterium]